ncbi:TIGR01777 family oxidoreductase [Flavobacterium restrictum]|uniref:TIGR01777 family protein n=1 Tax=Flavobacterium restrictum TaxID=2594428 RepID=A0A553E2J9_9FLAO|nr:TIGR01777 family oxidoreductase [Flavobacterium restrictum]TRX39258.1 TIGR01777 family protein [Flavobacterium restrictum]
MKKNVLITGGSGFIGKYLTAMLLEKGYSVSILSREKKENTTTVSYYTWDVTNQKIEEAAVLQADYIIHLAGENIADQRWTLKRKATIRASREESIALLYSVLKKNGKKLDGFVSASGIGIYGAYNGEGICTEETAAASDFLGVTCQQWEAAVAPIANLGIRTVKIRTGLVLGKNEGFLKKMLPVFKYGLGAALGSGQQYMPWIHIHDLCAMYIAAIENPAMQGAYNAVVADNTTNTIFSKKLAHVLGFALWLPNVPAFILHLMLGEMAVIVLTGRRVSSDKIRNLGFHFEFKDLEEALEDCLSK